MLKLVDENLGGLGELIIYHDPTIRKFLSLFIVFVKKKNASVKGQLAPCVTSQLPAHLAARHQCKVHPLNRVSLSLVTFYNHKLAESPIPRDSARPLLNTTPLFRRWLLFFRLQGHVSVVRFLVFNCPYPFVLQSPLLLP